MNTYFAECRGPFSITLHIRFAFRLSPQYRVLFKDVTWLIGNKRLGQRSILAQYQLFIMSFRNYCLGYFQPLTSKIGAEITITLQQQMFSQALWPEKQNAYKGLVNEIHRPSSSR